jgi:hypothetical protein
MIRQMDEKRHSSTQYFTETLVKIPIIFLACFTAILTLLTAGAYKNIFCSNLIEASITKSNLMHAFGFFLGRSHAVTWSLSGQTADQTASCENFSCIAAATLTNVFRLC